jgi:hypothetical protein
LSHCSYKPKITRRLQPRDVPRDQRWGVLGI